MRIMYVTCTGTCVRACLRAGPTFTPTLVPVPQCIVLICSGQVVLWSSRVPVAIGNHSARHRAGVRAHACSCSSVLAQAWCSFLGSRESRSGCVHLRASPKNQCFV